MGPLVHSWCIFEPPLAHFWCISGSFLSRPSVRAARACASVWDRACGAELAGPCGACAGCACGTGRAVRGRVGACACACVRCLCGHVRIFGTFLVNFGCIFDSLLVTFWLFFAYFWGTSARCHIFGAFLPPPPPRPSGGFLGPPRPL